MDSYFAPQEPLRNEILINVNLLNVYLPAESARYALAFKLEALENVIRDSQARKGYADVSSVRRHLLLMGVGSSWASSSR